MKIQVTQEDINKGTPCRCYSCPIALAIARALPESFPSVDEFLVIFNYPMPRRNPNPVNLPMEARDFVSRFDHGHSVEPFEFELDYTPR